MFSSVLRLPYPDYLFHTNESQDCFQHDIFHDGGNATPDFDQNIHIKNFQ